MWNHDRARLEQGEVAVLIGRNLPEGVQSHVRRLLHLGERNQPDIVRLSHLFDAQRTRMSRESPLPPSGDRSKAMMVGFMAGFLIAGEGLSAFTVATNGQSANRRGSNKDLRGAIPGP